LETKIIFQFLIAIACSIFIASIFLPFLQALWIEDFPVPVPGPESFWSFKKTEMYGLMFSGWRREEWWFADYWRREETIAPALIFMLTLQLLTVSCALLSIFKFKSHLLFSSIVFSILTLFCMWFVSYALGSANYKSFEAGFWLTIPSAAVFLVVFLLSRRQL